MESGHQEENSVARWLDWLQFWISSYCKDAVCLFFPFETLFISYFVQGLHSEKIFFRRKCTIWLGKLESQAPFGMHKSSFRISIIYVLQNFTKKENNFDRGVFSLKVYAMYDQ